MGDGTGSAYFIRPVSAAKDDRNPNHPPTCATHNSFIGKFAGVGSTLCLLEGPQREGTGRGCIFLTRSDVKLVAPPVLIRVHFFGEKAENQRDQSAQGNGSLPLRRH